MNKKIKQKIKFKQILNQRSVSAPEVKVTIRQETHHQKQQQTKGKGRILRKITKVKIVKLMKVIYNHNFN